jgi:prophage regulatory protein
MRTKGKLLTEGTRPPETMRLSNSVLPPNSDKQVFLRRPVVEARTGLSRSSLYDLIATGDFPKPVPLGRRTVGWIETEIADWQKRRISERDRKQHSTR